VATFTVFSDLLPDPNNKIDIAGVSNNSSAGSSGPGFAKVQLRSLNQIQTSRTISGRGVISSPGFHVWEISVTYNPITRSEFEPVASFLHSKQSGLRPFYVILPQYSAPQNSLFATYATSNLTGITVASNTPAGSNTVLIGGTSGMTEELAGNPTPGDFITFTDSTDVNHKKAYRIVGVETSAYYQEGTTAPTATQRRLRLDPPLSRNLSASSVVNFIKPKFRVKQKGDVLEYELGTDNLYQFSLSLEEIQP
jgi:hypothetical protein